MPSSGSFTSGDFATAPVSDLEKVLGGTAVASVPVPWAGLTSLNYIRKVLIAAASPAPGVVPEDDGLTILHLGQLTEGYNLVNALDAAVYTNRVLATRNTTAAVDLALQPAYSVVPLALLELQALKLPRQHVDTLNAYLISDSPISRVSGVSTMLTLGAIFQLHP